jgi:hypothetical protein
VGIGVERSPSIRSAQRALLKTISVAVAVAVAAASNGFDWYDYYCY